MFHPYLMTSGARQGAYVQKSDPPLPSLHVRLIQTLLVWMLNNADQYQQPSYPCSVLERRGDLLLLLLQIPFSPPFPSSDAIRMLRHHLFSSSLLLLPPRFLYIPQEKEKGGGGGGESDH